jgi:hypothetical protein
MRTVRVLLAVAFFALGAGGFSIHPAAAFAFVPAVVLTERHLAREE